MKTLILTEKPSVAKDFAAALNVTRRQNGFFESNAFCITWAVGHLVELYEPQDYDPKWAKWHMTGLPIIPERFLYRPIEKGKNQLTIIQTLLNRNDISDIVIATDAGREGEVIARTILLSAKSKNSHTVNRFWTSQALTAKVIKKEMAALKPLTAYDRLWQAGQARQIADWLVGMNGSRAASIKLNDLFSIGRVQTAVLSLITDRRRQREAFKREPYWVLKVDFTNPKGNWQGTWFNEKVSRFAKKSEAEEVIARINEQTGKIVSLKKQKKKVPPPLLYSLTDLQQDANRQFGFSAKKTLQLAQSLYENKKCLSYPRTDAKVLGTQNVDLAQSIVEKLKIPQPDKFAGIDQSRIHISNKRVFNDAQLTDHHALIPLDVLPNSVSADERHIYELVLNRFAAAFHPDHEYEQTDIITEVARQTFQTRGKIVIVAGWQDIYRNVRQTGDAKPEDIILPPLIKGDEAHVTSHHLQKKMTAPPPQYTDALLLKDMTNPGRYISEDELRKVFRSEVGLGTQATRAQIIEILLARHYVVRQKRFLIATDKGCRLIETLRQFKISAKLTSPKETARWEQQLHSIAQGLESETNFIDAIKEFVSQLVEEIKKAPLQLPAPVALGQCPQCGGNIIEGNRGYGCSNWKKEDGGCTFVIWKKQSGRLITRHMMADLLRNKKTGPTGGFKNENGTPYAAMLTLSNDVHSQTEPMAAEGRPENKWDIAIAPLNRIDPSDMPEIGHCPACGGDIIDTPKAFSCSNWKSENGGCQFKIWKTIAQKRLDRDTVVQLLENGISGVIEGFVSKKGSPFACRLILNSDKLGHYSINFDFGDR